MQPISLKTIFARLFDAMDRRDAATAWVIGAASCAPTAHGVGTLQVDVAAGSFVSNAGAFANFAGGNKTPAAAIANPHVDLIYIDNAGVLQLAAGAEASPNPVPPALPAGCLGLALVFVPPGAVDYGVATTAYIFDIRQFNAPMYLPDGTAPAPSLPFGNELGTGVFRPAATRWGVSISGAQVLDVGATYVAFGANPATSGVLRVPTNGPLVSRNNANSANKTLIKLNSSDVVEVDTDAVGTVLGGIVTVTGASLAVGTTPAASGVFRVPNNQVARARNAANSADLDLIGLNGSNKVVLGGQAPGIDGTVLMADAATTGGFKWAAPAGGAVSVLDKKVTDTTVVNTAAETDIYRKTITGNTIGANGILRLTLTGTSLNNSGGSQARQFRVKFGGTTLFDTGSVALPFNATRQQWRLDVVVWNAAATGTQRATASLWINMGATGSFVWIATSTANGPLMALGADGASSEDTTANKDLAVTVQLGVANAAFDVVAKEGVLELIA